VGWVPVRPRQFTAWILTLVILVARNRNHARPQDKAQVARAALPTTVRPQQKDRYDKKFNQTAPPRAQHLFTKTQGTTTGTE
jgi:hypothetical protein